MATNIIDKSDPGIVMQETTISLSDEKFKSILLKTYERAQADMNKPSLSKHYSILLSIAGTLFLTLLTSDFGSIGKIEADIVTLCARIIFVICAVGGFILMAITVSKKTKNSTEERDKAISEIFESHSNQ